jgi:hypothetical protein
MLVVYPEHQEIPDKPCGGRPVKKRVLHQGRSILRPMDVCSFQNITVKNTMYDLCISQFYDLEHLEVR